MPRVWQNVFVVKGVPYIGALFHTLLILSLGWQILFFIPGSLFYRSLLYLNSWFKVCPCLARQNKMTTAMQMKWTWKLSLTDLHLFMYSSLQFAPVNTFWSILLTTGEHVIVQGISLIKRSLTYGIVFGVKLVKAMESVPILRKKSASLIKNFHRMIGFEIGTRICEINVLWPPKWEWCIHGKQ